MIFFTKAIRSMLQNKKAYISCILLMVLGSFMYMCMGTAVYQMNSSKDDYYADCNLGDVFASVIKMPESAIFDLESIEGIDKVSGRIVNEARVYDNSTHIKTLRLISVDRTLGENRLNNYVYVDNNLSNYNDILLGQDFLIGNQYIIGNKLNILINGRIEEFNIGGGVYSPEYIYLLKDPTALFNDNLTFNFAYVDEEYLAQIYNMSGFYNDVSFTLEEGYVYDDIKDEAKYILEKYGLISLTPVEDLLSYNYMEMEMESAGSMTTSLSIIFVGISSIILYLMLKRIIEKDRSQIGTLKAFGYSDWHIILHYLYYGIVTGFIAGILGIVISYFSTPAMIDFYLHYFKMPIKTDVTTYKFYINGFFISLIGGFIGAYFGVIKIIKLNPAESMRPEAPRIVKNDILNFIPFLKILLTEDGKMAVRNISRNKIRSVFVVIGITFSFGIMTIIAVMGSIMDDQIFGKFENMYKYDGRIVLENLIDYDNGINEVLSNEYIDNAEGILTMDIMIKNRFKSYGTKVIGLNENSDLYKIYDDKEKKTIPINKNGIIIGDIMAKELGVSVGNSVNIYSPYFDDYKEVIISRIVTMSSTDTYMDFEYLNDIFATNNQVNNILFTTNNMDNFRKIILNARNVKDIYEKSLEEEFTRELMGVTTTSINIIVVVGVALSFIIIYNSAIISLSERNREYATLRVIGFSINEVKQIMNFEYWILSFLGIIFGIPFANTLIKGLNKMMNVDTFKFPEEIGFSSYFIAIIGIIFSVCISNYMSGKAVARFQLVDVLKERE